MKKVRIGMLVAVPEKWKLETNWSLFEDLVCRHVGYGVDVFITPECFLDGYAVTDQEWSLEKFVQVAQSLDDSPYVERLKMLAQRLQAYVVFGLTEYQADHFYNCALLIDRQGNLLGKYHKTHLQGHDLRFMPGNDLPVFKLDFGTVGMVICADRRWPETIRALRLKGTELVATASMY